MGRFGVKSHVFESVHEHDKLIARCIMTREYIHVRTLLLL